MARHIVVRGARVHNLKNIDLAVPREKLVVITGVSGSGKSSLAFDTLFAEGQRRYLESLAADARQFLRQLPRPDVDSIDGLPPAVAIQQTGGNYTTRSTVGTITEIYDYLRLLFARLGRPTCPACGRTIERHTLAQVADALLALPRQTRLAVLAPVTAAHPGGLRRRLEELASEGFSRIKSGPDSYDLADSLDALPGDLLTADLVIDRLVLREGIDKRLWDSLETAARHGEQVVKVDTQGDEVPAETKTFSLKLSCLGCGTEIPEYSPASFSFNNPEGACPVCNGTGVIGESGKRANPQNVRCGACDGSRLRKESLAVKVGGQNIAEVAALAVRDCIVFVGSLRFDGTDAIIGASIVEAVTRRLRFLARVGLDYLSLDRGSLTLAGGELQRVRLAGQLGAELAGVLYILDEPSIGLHPRDNAALLALLKELRDADNSVVVVEHDRDAIFAADHVIELGPGAGTSGGQVIAAGAPAELLLNDHSLTGRYLSRRIDIPVPKLRRPGSGDCILIQGARQHNLKNLAVKIPVAAMTCVTGVSGSGKSSLVMDILYSDAARHFNRYRGAVGDCDSVSGWEHFDRVVGIDQSPIGRTSRSNPATYTGLFDHLRALFAQLPEARVRGYGSERFSFNAKGGRCDGCDGEGAVKVEMYLLPEILVVCDVCKGRRFNRETLGIRYKGLSIADALDLTVTQAAEFFSAIPGIASRLQMLNAVGLGYLALGQPATSLSGGEAQRVKLARELSRRATGRSLYVLDEPTTGLHFEDIRRLLEVLHRLVDEGNTMVIVEHDLDVIKTVDYILDLGPGGGEWGGRIVAQGTPEEIMESADSETGKCLKAALQDDAGPESRAQPKRG